MARARADVREAELVQELAHRALVVDHAEALSDEMLQVHPPPAHDAVHGPIRSGLDEVGQRGLLLGGEAGRLALGPAVLQSVRAMLIEAVDPIAKGLAVHAADARCVGPVHAVQDGGQRQQAPALVHILGCGREPSKLTGREICPH
jgi:hypothetical protein